MNAEDYRLAALGDADAQVRVADYYDEYLRGEHDGPIDVSDETAKELILKYYKLAAAQGNAEAHFRLYEMYYCAFEDFIDQDLETAREWLEKAVELGYTEAIYVAGRCYKEGELFEKNPDKAEEYFKLVTEKDPNYGVKIGFLYDMFEDEENMYRWFKVAAEHGNSNAMELLGDFCCEDPEEGFEWTLKAAERGENGAQHSLAERYYWGYGVERDLAKAFHWYQKSDTIASSQSRLGDYNYFGIGVNENWEEAVQWYQKAANQFIGDDHAQQMLGNCYFYGAGVEVDFEKAVYWYNQATKHGDCIAEQMLADCYYFGIGVERDVSKAFERYYQAVLTIQTYGDFYYFGLGVPVDKNKAFEAYKTAAPYDVRAQRMLGNCYYYGHGTKRNVEEAIHWYRKAAMHRDNYSLEMVNLYYTAHEGEEAEKWFETAAKIGGDQYGYASHVREYSKKAE